MSQKNDRVFDDVAKNLEKFQQEYADIFLSRVQARTPSNTGALRDSWQRQVNDNEILITNDKDYASAIEYGTKHIEPRAMLRTTALEAEQIAEEAARKAGLK